LITEGGHMALVPPQLVQPDLLRGRLRVMEVDIPQGARSVGIFHLPGTRRLPLMESIKGIVRDGMMVSGAR
jgi:hypothetical protein